MAIFGRSFPFPRRNVSKAPPSGSGTILTAAQGSYTLTGETALFSQTQFGQLVKPHRLADRPRPKLGVFIGKLIPPTNTTLTASFGSYTLTGEAALFNTTMPAAQGSYTLTGEPATFSQTQFGKYVFVKAPARPRTKTSVFISEPPPPTGTSGQVTANTGNFTLTGEVVNFIETRFASGSFVTGLLPQRKPYPGHVFIGKAVPSASSSVTASTGSYSLTGEGALFTTTAPAGQGSYTLTGEGSLFVTTMPADTGTYGLIGNDVMFASSSITMAADFGSYVLTGFDAGTVGTVPPGGAAYVVHTYTRKRHQELMAQIAAERRAAQKAAEKAKPEQRKIIERAVNASGVLSGALLDVAGITPEVETAARLHIANLAALTAARTRADAQAKAAILVRHVQDTLDAMEEEELETLLFLN